MGPIGCKQTCSEKLLLPIVLCLFIPEAFSGSAPMQTLSDMPLDGFDVSDPALFRDDTWQPLFARLRREDPVHYCANSPFGPYWSITKYRDIESVELDPATFSAEIRGNKIDDPPPGTRPPTFIRMDPPKHTEQRRAVAPIASPSNVALYEPELRRRTGDALDALPRGEIFNWVSRVSVELTTSMLATMTRFALGPARANWLFGLKLSLPTSMHQTLS